MLAPSSPIAFPASSSPINNKRPRPTDAPKPAKPRVLGGFLADDDSESDHDDQSHEQPSPKRRMLHQDTQDARIDAEQNQETSLNKNANETQTAAQDTISTPPDSQSHDEEETERYERLFGRQGPRILESFTSGDPSRLQYKYQLSTCSGKTVPIAARKPTAPVSYETMVAARSRTKEGRAHKSYYGIAIHELIDSANKELAQARKETAAAATATAPVTPPAYPDKPLRSVEKDHAPTAKKPKHTKLWTEKYRARTFIDLVGDDLTNRQVLRWLKRWDPLVFPHAGRHRPTTAHKRIGQQQQQQGQGQQQPDEQENPHRKILMLHGPPGLGKTTLAHVCARQAGYEVLEINASDERSKDVVKGRIRTSLGTESVKTVEHSTKARAETGKQKVARPVCVVVDEVDGVVSGSGGSGDGGFVKALIDLVMLDQKNSGGGGGSGAAGRRGKKKTDDFRQMRPLILICNDVYHPSLRPLRQSGLAEVIHVGKPTVEAVVTRLKGIFEKEGIPCEKDAARRLCEAAWGMTSGIDAKRGAESNVEGDLRGVMVVGEWVAGRFRATSPGSSLTRQWVDRHIIHDLAHGGGGARGLGRGGVKEIVSRIFQDGAGFPKQAAPSQPQVSKHTRHEQPQTQLGFAEQQKKYAMARLREMIDTSGETDRIVTDIFLEYPNRDFNDDSFLTKPDAAYEWLHFHDACSSRVYASQEWELAPYTSLPVLACHHLFASPRRHVPPAATGIGGGRWGDDAGELAAPPVPFSGPRADFAAREAEKEHRAALQGLHARLPPALTRSFRGPEHIATDLLPYLVRLVAPDVKPVLVGGGGNDKNGGGAVASVRREGEKAMVRRAAQVLAEVGVELHRGRIEQPDGAVGAVVGRTLWVYRMEPDLDALSTFETAAAYVQAPPTRYAVRQVLDQELQKTLAQRENAARQARLRSGGAAITINHAGHNQMADEDGDKENLTRRNDKLGGGPGAGNVKRDFFGRVIAERPALAQADGNAAGRKQRGKQGGIGGEEGVKVWVTYHEGINNAVRKPISLEEFMRGF